jgi:sugar phosphate isomerase/epimerase
MMHDRISVSTISSIHQTLAQDIDLYARAGIDTAGVLFRKLAQDITGGIAAIRLAGLRCSCVVAGDFATPLIGRGGRDALDVIAPAIDVAAELGCPPCYFPSGLTPPRMTTDHAYAALVDALAAVVAHAASKQVPVGVENNSTATRDNGFIHTLIDAADLSADTGIGICLDLQNCWTERHLDRLFRKHVDRFVLVQVSDFKVGEAARLNRRVPGDGDMPLEWMLERLLDAGYQGLFDIEILGPKIEEEGYASAIGRSIEWLSERLQKWGV